MAALDEGLSTGRLDGKGDRSDSTAQQIEAMRSHVWVVDDRLLVLHEVANQSVLSIDLIFDRLEELAQPWPRFGYVADLTDAGRPTAEVRAELRRRAEGIRPRLLWVAIVVGPNVIMRAMARLVAHAIGLGPVSSIHTTREEGISKVRDVLAERESPH
jgi:hypothetical protein